MKVIRKLEAFESNFGKLTIRYKKLESYFLGEGGSYQDLKSNLRKLGVDRNQLSKVTFGPPGSYTKLE